jgi:G3E family GTPase
MDCAIPDGTKHPTSLPKKRAPLGIDCMSVIPAKLFSLESLSHLLAELDRGRFGRIIRAKGFIQVGGRGWMNLQIASGQVTMEQLPVVMAPRLTLIGFDLKAEELNQFLR